MRLNFIPFTDPPLRAFWELLAVYILIFWYSLVFFGIIDTLLHLPFHFRCVIPVLLFFTIPHRVYFHDYFPSPLFHLHPPPRHSYYRSDCLSPFPLLLLLLSSTTCCQSHLTFFLRPSHHWEPRQSLSKRVASRQHSPTYQDLRLRTSVAP